MGHWLSVVTSSVIARRQSSFHRRLQLQELYQSDLDIMGDDGDGHVSRAEFLEFMLIAMNRVDKEFIDEMRCHFARLDTDNTGFLSMDDLIASAKRKLQNPHHKLQLANYKEQLLQQAADASQGDGEAPFGEGSTRNFPFQICFLTREIPAGAVLVRLFKRIFPFHEQSATLDSNVYFL
jgi:hypothetical protein